MPRPVLSLLALCLLAGPGCSTAKKAAVSVGRALHIIDSPAPKPPAEAPKQFRESLAMMDDQKFEQALNGLEAFLQAEPTSPWTQSATYHQGRALEGLNQWSEAAERYRSVISATANAPKLQAMSLYRLSFCHEALGDDQQTLADLHDLLGRTEGLPKEVKGAELPARLAGAYARVGSFDEAVEFYKKAESGVARLKHETGSAKIPDWLPQTLYYMGTVSARNVGWDDFEASLRPLARSQIYLLQAAELGVLPWSERAGKDLISLYGRLWGVIENPPRDPAGVSILREREIQKLQWARAELLLANLAELRARSLSTEPKLGSPYSRQIATFTGEVEKKIHDLFEIRLAGEGPTEESLLRKASLRGRVVAPDSSLEKKFLESARTSLPDKKVKPKPEDDPNL